MLPAMLHKDNISKWRTAQFGGIVNVKGAGNGDIADDENFVSDEYPVLKTRDAMYLTENFDGSFGAFRDIRLSDTGVEYGSTSITGSLCLFTESEGLQSFTEFNNMLLLLPTKRYIRADVRGFRASVGTLPIDAEYGDVWGVYVGSDPGQGGDSSCDYHAYYWDGAQWNEIGPVVGAIESSVSTSVTFEDGEYAGTYVTGNTIKAANNTFDWSAYFSVGDAVQISGSQDNDQTIIVREISGDELRFYANSFTDTQTAETVTVSRNMPEMDAICVNENRVWGYHRTHIYASKLGDFRNWEVFDGLSSDSYALDILSGGDITGCISYLGYPTFFKEDGIYKVYGTRPDNFQLMGSASTGCINGRTLAICNETLYYVSRVGVMAYTGGKPACVSDVLGNAPLTESAFAFSDNVKYRLFNGTQYFLEYDPKRDMWHQEVLPFYAFYAYLRDHKIAYVGSDMTLLAEDGDEKETIKFSVEFADFTEDSSDYPQYGANKKGTGKLHVRMVLGENTVCSIRMMFDSTNEWDTVQTFATRERKRSYYLPIIPRRNDHFRIKFEGEGYMELYSLARESYKGSAL